LLREGKEGESDKDEMREEGKEERKRVREIM
jgi:hypothetical protein